MYFTILYFCVRIHLDLFGDFAVFWKRQCYNAGVVTCPAGYLMNLAYASVEQLYRKALSLNWPVIVQVLKNKVMWRSRSVVFCNSTLLEL